MKHRALLRALALTPVLLVIALVVAPRTIAQDDVQSIDAAPTAAHRLLRREVGRWNAVVTLQGEQSQAVETCRMVGEVWLLTEFEGELSGSNFTGVGLMGYDPERQRYTQTWFDNTSPREKQMVGTASKDGRFREFTWKELDPATGRLVPQRGVHEYLDENRRRYEQFTDGATAPAIVVEYVRTR